MEQRSDCLTVFGPGGALATAHPGYERREGQEEMALAVERVLRDGGSLLMEAGTGVGKTLAYLVPAALSGRRVVVSTGTKTLQDQIIDKDLPFVEQRLGIPLTAAVVKGRENYLCIRRFRDFDREPRLPTIQEAGIYETVSAWGRSTGTGDRGEATTLPDDASFWRKINARSDTCTGQKCEDYENCFLTRVRRRAEASRIVVVNHHLFFADLALRGDAFGRVLPDYEAAIFDEAHLIEETATLFFGVSITSSRIEELAEDAARLLDAAEAGSGRVAGPDEERGPAGFAGTRRGEAEQGDWREGGKRRKGRAPGSRRGDGRGRRALPVEAETLKGAASSFFGLFAEKQGRNLLDERTVGPAFTERVEPLLRALGGIEAVAERSDPAADEWVALGRRCRELASQLEFLAKRDDESYVYWAEARRRHVTLTASPVDVSDLLAETLFSRLHAAVLTSATLSVDASFEFVRTRLGIRDADERIVPSPFDYGQ